MNFQLFLFYGNGRLKRFCSLPLWNFSTTLIEKIFKDLYLLISTKLDNRNIVTKFRLTRLRYNPMRKRLKRKFRRNWSKKRGPAAPDSPRFSFVKFRLLKCKRLNIELYSFEVLVCKNEFYKSIRF